MLILREVLCWQAAEVAELLDTTVASVNSALQRARATLASIRDEGSAAPVRPLDQNQRELLERYVQAFERYDMDGATYADGVHRVGDFRMVWFKDPDGNILHLNSEG